MSGALLLAIVTLVTLVDFLVGLHLARRGTRTVGAPPAEAAAAPANARAAGRMIMLASLAAWLVVAALCFGLFGDVGIDPIVLGSAP